MKRFQTTIASLILLLGVGAVAAGPAQAGQAQNALKTKALRKQMRKMDLNPVHAKCIPDRRSGGVVYTYKCNWQARGTWPGAIPYRCYGKASYVVAKRRWTIDPCENKIGTRIPLDPTPSGRPVFGYNDDWAGHRSKLEDLARIGGTVARQNLAWKIVQHNRNDAPDWEYYDAVYEKMQAEGIRPLWVLVNAPCWAQSNPTQCENGKDQMRPAPDQYDGLAEFALAAAERYPDSAGIEVWNEPNFAPFWGGPPDPDQYSRMLSTVAGAFTDSPMPVISGGLSPHGDGASSKLAIDQSTFLRKMFQNGAAQMVDGIGTHPYPGTSSPGTIVDQLRARLGELRDVMTEFGEPDKPLWVTEVGVSTTGKDKLTEDQQAKALVDIYDTLRRVRQVPTVVFHRFISGTGVSDREPGFGVFDGKGDRKPAFCAVAGVVGKPCG